MTIGKKLRDVWRSISKNDLAEEIAGPDAFGIRQGWNASEVASVIDPAGLARLIQSAKTGDLSDYLTLAEEIEERDLHYRSVLSTRKLPIVGLDPVVKPADDSTKAGTIADAVTRDIVDRPQFADLVMNTLDGIAKGFSVNEVMWDTSRTPWRPARYEWRDQRWFDYDRVSGRQLGLREGAEVVPLAPYKFVVHEPLLKSGLPIRGGLALPVTYYHLIKSFDVAGWAAFIEVFGYPIRIGKYGKNATPHDKSVLKTAVRNIGRDIGAIIPDAMTIETVDGVKPGGTTNHFEKLAEWVDKQISKGVLGQTASTEGTPGKLGDENEQGEVRRDIKRSDAKQLETTLNRDLVIPYVDLNYGQQEAYPYLRLPVPDPEDVTALVENIATLVPFGFRVKTSEMYAKLGLTAPDDDDEVLLAGVPPADEEPANDETAQNAEGADVEANAAGDEDDIEAIAAGVEWEPFTQPLHEAVAALSAECNSYEEFERRLPELLSRIDTEALTTQLAIDMFKARSHGDAEFEADE